MDPRARLRHRLLNTAHSVLLLAGMSGLLGLLGWVVAGPDGLLVTAVVVPLGLALAPRVSPRLVLRMYGATELTPHHAPPLFALLRELAARAGLPAAPRLFYVPSRVLNAFTVGRRDEAAVAVTDGLLRAMTPRELAGVLAHELAHVQNNDMWVMGLADVVSRLTAMLSLAGQALLIVMIPATLIGGYDFPLLALLLLIAAPWAASLMQLALSRSREFDADLGAAEITGDPRGLASALDKLERFHGGLLERLFLPGARVPDPSSLRTHPPTAERVRRLLELAPAPLPEAIAVPRLGTVPIQAFPVVARQPRWRILGTWY